MKTFLMLLLLLLAPLAALAQPAEAPARAEQLYSAILGTNFGDREATVAFLRKTTHFRLSEEAWPLMLEDGHPYAGVRKAHQWGLAMLRYFEANGHPNLMKLDAASRDAELDKIAASYQFTLILDAPASKDNWRNFCNYWGQLDELFHFGWAPKSGVAMITLKATPQARTFSATSDGKKFDITTPVLEIPTSQWGKTVQPVLDRFGTKVNRT